MAPAPVSFGGAKTTEGVTPELRRGGLTARARVATMVAERDRLECKPRNLIAPCRRAAAAVRWRSVARASRRIAGSLCEHRTRCTGRGRPQQAKAGPRPSGVQRQRATDRQLEDLILQASGSATPVVIGAGGFASLKRHVIALPIELLQERDGVFTLIGATKQVVRGLAMRKSRQLRKPGLRHPTASHKLADERVRGRKYRFDGAAYRPRVRGSTAACRRSASCTLRRFLSDPR